MRIFDHVDPRSLDRREWHLWTLALGMIVILSSGMALLMYPTAFSDPLILTGTTLRKVFFGFCGLSVLTVGYLVDRQITLRTLRRQLVEQERRVRDLRQEASIDFLATLPGFTHFQDRLAMEYRRASGSRQSLSLLVIDLKPSRDLTHTAEVSTAFGDAAKALTRKLRGEDSIYCFAPGAFGIVLPGVSVSDAYRVVSRLEDGLNDAAGASSRFSFDIRVVTYPDHVVSAREMEDVVRSRLPKNESDGAQTQAA
ncbi:MAG: GGDEF domain-containing protein [Terriglobia bacterium]